MDDDERETNEERYGSGEGGESGESGESAESRESRGSGESAETVDCPRCDRPVYHVSSTGPGTHHVYPCGHPVSVAFARAQVERESTEE